MLEHACDTEMAQNSNHVCLKFYSSSNCGLSQDFRAEKSELTRDFDT